MDPSADILVDVGESVDALSKLEVPQLPDLRRPEVSDEPLLRDDGCVFVGEIRRRRIGAGRADRA
jgi:hypothetical protein